MTEKTLKPRDVGPGPFPGLSDKKAVEFATALYIAFCKDKNEWEPVDWPVMQKFIVQKRDELIFEQLGDKGLLPSRIPEWFRSAIAVNLWPDFKWLLDNGYMRTTDGSVTLSAQALEPTPLFFSSVAA